MAGRKEKGAEFPMPIKAVPYHHQMEAFRFACGLFGILPGEGKEAGSRDAPSRLQSSGAALLMEMGTGKTLTTIGITGALSNAGRMDIQPVLRIRLRRQYLIEAVQRLINKALLRQYRLDPGLQCRALLHHAAGHVNVKPDKEKSTEKIDGAVAAVMALDRAIRGGGEIGASIYDERGLLLL